MADLTTKIGGLTLKNPVMTASGTFGYGLEFQDFVPLEELGGIIGKELTEKLKNAAISLYTQAADYARERGIIVADTKFEFGLDEQGGLVLADEVLTPDSSRFWPVASYTPGKNPSSLDKQFVRDWLDSVHFNHQPPAPELPQDIVEKTAEKYRNALEVLKK